MARPRKEGMDYFPHDTDAVNDEKIEALRALYGNDGYAVYFILLERIYRSNEFELSVSDAETRQILAKKCAVTLDKFEQILASALKYECFDQKAYDERGVLTSNGVKKRANVVVEKRKTMRKRYKNQAMAATEVSDAETTQETNAEMQQSKVKQSKAKHSKAKHSKALILTTSAPLPPIDDVVNESDEPSQVTAVIPVDATEHERTILAVLKSVKGYKLDYLVDLHYIRELATDYPTVNILDESKKWATRKLDDPLKQSSKPRSQFRNWCQKACEFQSMAPYRSRSPSRQRSNSTYAGTPGISDERMRAYEGVVQRA